MEGEATGREETFRYRRGISLAYTAYAVFFIVFSNLMTIVFVSLTIAEPGLWVVAVLPMVIIPLIVSAYIMRYRVEARTFCLRVDARGFQREGDSFIPWSSVTRVISHSNSWLSAFAYNSAVADRLKVWYVDPQTGKTRKAFWHEGIQDYFRLKEIVLSRIPSHLREDRLA